MLESLPFTIAVVTLFGFLGGIGVGGGSLLIMWLSFVIGMEHHDARVLNLIFFLPCAIIASIFRWKQGVLHVKKVLPACLCGCIAAGIGAYASPLLNLSILKKLFGGLLIVTGMQEILYKHKNKEHL